MSSTAENGPLDKENGNGQCAENTAFDENTNTKPNSYEITINSPDGDHDHNLISTDPKHASPDISDGDGMATVSSSCCCAACRTGCLNRFSTKRNPLPASASFARRLRYAFLCPPHGHVARTITLVFVVAYVWFTLWAVLGHEALPGGNYFALIALLVLCVIAGEIVEKIHLPPLLGMLCMGVALRNVPVINVAKDIDPYWSSALRNIALVIILSRAGLGLDPVALKKLSFGVIRLAFSPCLVETACCAVSSHLLLDMPWTWGIMLGFVISAVSPAVVVPCLLSLSERGYGIDKGIPTLVIAASSIDDVLAISGFGIMLGISFSKGNLAVTIIKGPLEALAGVVYGIVLGIVAWYIPQQKHDHKTLFRFVILFFGGLLVTFGSRALDLAGAGALGCLTLAFVAALGWRKELHLGEHMPMADIMGGMWMLFQPLLFGLIGAEVNISNVKESTILKGLAVLGIGLTIRLIVSFFAVAGLGFNLRERIFITLAWMPKATVQAAIGSIALDTAREKNASSEVIEYGLQILTIAVLVILITAPIGAVAITVSGPKLLTKTSRSISEVRVPASETSIANTHPDEVERVV